MSSPRKFSEKIALIQQKQAEDDAAFNTIIYEVEAAKQRTDRVPSTKRKLDVPPRKHEASNGINPSHTNNNYNNQSIKIENNNNNSSDRLLLPPDNSSWRRTHSDSSLHQSMMPTVIANYHAQLDQDQQLNFDMNDIKLNPPSYTGHHHLQASNSQMQQNQYFDFNNNNYANDQANIFYSPAQALQQTLSSPAAAATTITNTNHTLLGPRFSGGSSNSNVLMLPPNQNSRGNSGSLPDLRNGNYYNNNNNNNNNNQLSFSTVPSPPQHFLRSLSPQQNSDGDLFVLGPQQHLPSSIGPLKQSPSIRRRHSPIGEVKQSSPRRQHSPSSDVSSNQQQNLYRVESQSPPSLPSYSPQNSPHLLPSPANELTPFSPQQQSADNQQPYYTLPNHLDQITLDNNFYTQQRPSSPASQLKHNHSLPTTPGVTNGFHQRDFYPSFIDDMASSYCHNQTSVIITKSVNQKSPTIPNIILTDVDSAKSDLSKELANDFSNAFDSLIDATGLQLNMDDFLLNAEDISVDPNICDDAFCMER